MTRPRIESESPMRVLIIAIATTIAVAALTSTARADVTLRVSDNYFVRANAALPTVTIASGDTVIWSFVGRSAHNVTARSGPERFRSRTMISGDFKQTFTETATYRIYCTIHGARDMSMRLRVTSDDEPAGAQSVVTTSQTHTPIAAIAPST
jgi:plastocyanin